jgi:outer membrane lipoprotein carrier protein
VAAGELDAAQVVGEIQRWLDDTRTLECRFEQTLLSGALGSGMSESGRLYLNRPGRMRWEYTKPESKIALVNGDQGMLYLPEESQLIRGGEGWNDSLVPVLLSGRGRLSDLFEATLVATPSGGGKGAYRVRLAPIGQEEGFEEVTLTVEPPAFALQEAEVLDQAGNRLHYRFRGLRRNRAIDPSLFHLEPPPGTEIVDSF